MVSFCLIFAIGWVAMFSNRPTLAYSEPDYSLATPLARQCTWLYRENPKDCRSYFQCLNGRSVLRKCPKALYWNAEGSYCDWQFRTGCKSSKGSIPKQNSIQGLLENPKETVEGKKNKASCPPNTYHAYPGDCNKYIQCGTNGQTVQSCNPGLHWDTQHNTCNWPDMAHCQAGSSGGSSASIASVTEAPTTTTTTPFTTTTTTTTPRPAPTVVSTVSPWTTTTTTIPTTTTQRPTTTTQRPTTTTVSTVRPKPTQPSGGDATQYPILQPTGYRVVCYFSGWAVYRPHGGSYTPADVDPSLCTHIIYAFSCMNDRTYKMEMCDSWIDGPDGKDFYGQITAFKKLGVKVMVAVGGWNDSAYPKWTEVLKDPTKMETFIRSVSEFLKKYGFQGLDIDYEYPGCPQALCNFASKFEKQAFVALVKGLRQMCSPETILSAAVSCNENIIREAYDVPTLSKLLDFFNLMAYDFHGAWDGMTGHNAPLHKCDGDKQYLNAYHAIQTFVGMRAPAERLNLGIPMYAQTFQLADAKQNGLGAKVTGPGAAGNITRQKGLMAYFEMCQLDWTAEVHDPEMRAGVYMYNAPSGLWASRDSKAIVEKKMETIESLGLGGAMIWSLDLDDWRNICGEGRYPLLGTINKRLRGPNTPKRKASKPSSNSRIPSSKKTKLRSRRPPRH